MDWMYSLVLWVVVVILQTAAGKAPANVKVCQTPECVEAANVVTYNMDRTVDPCRDFYQFACGGYVRKQMIPPDKSQYSAFVTVDDILQNRLLTLIETPPKPGDPRPFTLAKNLYNSCLREDLIEARGVSFIIDKLNQAGGWPLLMGSKWNESAFNWVDTVYKLHDVGLGAELLDFSISINMANSFKRVVEIDQASFGLEKEHLLVGRENMLVQAYNSYMVDIAVLFGANRHEAEEELSQALDFEINLARITMSEEERRDFSKVFNPMELQLVQQRYPYLQWDQYLRRLMNNLTYMWPNEEIIVNAPSYLEKLPKLLNITTKRTLANHMMWRAVAGTISVLTKAMKNRQQIYNEVISGRKEVEARWKDCLGIVSSSLPLAIGALYARNYFTEEARINALNMTEDITHEMVKILEEIDWMDEVTRGLAIDKAAALQKHIAYPIELLDDKLLEDFYSNLELTGEAFFETVLNITRFGWTYSIHKLRETINKTDWRSHGFAAVINAFYNPMENSVQFPAGILQNVFFSHGRPRYMNYGGIGFVIGHEITHAFDQMGKQFDKVGNLVVWWKPKAEEEFKKRKECIINQAGNYTVESVNLKLNGVHMQSENIADRGGAKLMNRAYSRWASQNPEEPRLPTLEKYTPEQMLWLSTASMWCTVYRSAALKRQVTTGYHAPAEYRVNGAAMNSETFAKDFNCPVGSPMYLPESERCNVW